MTVATHPAATRTGAEEPRVVAAAGPRARVACAHCGLAVREPWPVAGDEPFCCAGCATAYAVIHDLGLERYYRLPERRQAPVSPSEHSFEEFDHPTFHRLYAWRRGPLLETELYLEGIHCSSCVWLVERAPLSIPGVASVELDWTRGRATVAWDEGQARLSEIARFLATLGYRAHPLRGGQADRLRRTEDRAMIARIGVAGAIAANVMLASLALYSGWFGDMEPAYRGYFRWICLLLATPALLYPGRVFFRGAWAALRARSLHMDVPIALALGAGYARGAVNTITGSGPIYLDGVTLLVFLLLAGRYLQMRAQRAAVDSTELLASLAPATARVRDASGVAREVPAESLLPGATLEVWPGDAVAADGTVLEGRSELDLSLLTGESRPAAVEPGDRVFAGTLNCAATLVVRVEHAGEASRLGRMLRQVEEGARRRARVVRLADRLAGGFVGVVLALAAATAALWYARDPSVALDRAIALLVVTCPCALALATPLAVTVAIGRAARAGILVKGGDALERLARPGRMILDKTGTVTEGRVVLVAWEGEEEAKPWVLALERDSVHPIARAFAAAWSEVAIPPARDVAHVPGGGVTGEVAGRRVAVGSPAFVCARLDTRYDSNREREALTPVWVAVDGRRAGRAWLGDRVRSEAREAIAELTRRGWEVEILSGDDPEVVERVGVEVGLSPARCRGGASPEEKLDAVAAAAGSTPVVMVGDGVNDAAAIARADVGVGMRGGAEACLAAADVFLTRADLMSLVALTRGAARTLGVIRRTIAFSLLYNLLGAVLAITGVINPLIAAILMPLSSLTVVLMAWSARTFEARPR